VTRTRQRLLRFRHDRAHPCLGLRRRQAGSLFHHPHQIGPVIGSHSFVAKSGRDDPRCLRANLCIAGVGKLSVRSKQLIEL
jgi:hypothetical protein